MSTFASDDETAEAVKKWWLDNGRSIVMGAVVGISAVVGWQWWQEHRNQSAEAAAELYFQLQNNGVEESGPVAQRLRSDYASTPYAVMAAMLQAKAAVDASAWDQAIEHLRWAETNASLPEIQSLSRLRQARVLVAAGRGDEALKLLESVAGYAALSDELRGDIKVASGDQQAALEAYRRALEAGGDGRTLQMKIDNLGG